MSAKPKSPIESLIDAACGFQPSEPPPVELSDEEREACARLGRDVLSNLRIYYPDVVKTRPTTWPLHLRNTIAAEAGKMLKGILTDRKS